MADQENKYTRLAYGSLIDQLGSKYDGIRVIGDVHGQYEAYEEAVKDAIVNNLFPVQLGDLVDRGEGSYECLATALWLREQGHGLFIAGNHEHKHYRYMLDENLEIKPHHIPTIKQLENLSNDELFLFLEFMQQKNYVIKWENFRFSHASYNPLFEKNENLSKKELRFIHQYALYGPHYNLILEEPKLKYSWIEDIPKGVVCIVGHTTFDDITLVENDNGGIVYFIDIGCERREPAKVGYLDIFRNGQIKPSQRVVKTTTKVLYETARQTIKEFKDKKRGANVARGID